MGLRGGFGFLCIGGFELVASRGALKILVFVGVGVMGGWYLVSGVGCFGILWCSWISCVFWFCVNCYNIDSLTCYVYAVVVWRWFVCLGCLGFRSGGWFGCFGCWFWCGLDFLIWCCGGGVLLFWFVF